MKSKIDKNKTNVFKLSQKKKFINIVKKKNQNIHITFYNFRVYDSIVIFLSEFNFFHFTFKYKNDLFEYLIFRLIF